MALSAQTTYSAAMSKLQRGDRPGRTARTLFARWSPRAPLAGLIMTIIQLACSSEPSVNDPSPSVDAGLMDAAMAADVGVRADAGAAPTDDEFVPLFGPSTDLAPPLVEDNGAALITRFSDRARDRHARESQFQAYEHYLALYWEHRTAQIEIEDPIGHGGDTIRFRITTEWRLHPRQAELRLFFRGLNTVAEYHDNRVMTAVDARHYTHEVSFNAREGRALMVGDRMEFELSQFLDAPPRGRSNYYGTTYLYVVGQGIAPWRAQGPIRDSTPIPGPARLGGDLTIHENESNEPTFAFSQMATNLAPQNAQPFVRGRRLMHTNFDDGRHDESAENPTWTAQVGKLGPTYVARSCNTCHLKNGRAIPPSPGAELTGYIFKVGDANSDTHPTLGAVIQSEGPNGEGRVDLSGWTEEEDGLRRPQYTFSGATPERFSARVSPPLVGIGLLEAIPEEAIALHADPDDADGDGISGRMHIVRDPAGVNRLGRFGWKAGQPTVRAQTASAFRTDMGVLTTVFTTPDCGAAQGDCGPNGAELEDADLDDLVKYVALLGVPPQRGFEDPDVVAGAAVFEELGCETCHVASFVTSAYVPDAELRGQTIKPYTDLLLHDMGPGLADALPEGRASGAEWRTAPLWSLGRTAGVSGGEAYLHDGRARTLEEAIQWHGGEADAARRQFMAASETRRAQLLAFLRSL